MKEPEDEAPELKTCRRCGAEAMLVNRAAREFYVRVHCYSRCRDGYQSTCRTATCTTATEARAAWNARGREDETQ